MDIVQLLTILDVTWTHEKANRAALPLAILLLIFFLFYITTKRTKENSNDKKLNMDKKEQNEEITDEDISDLEIPKNCPHCKNPNMERRRMCEWCGNPII